MRLFAEATTVVDNKYGVMALIIATVLPLVGYYVQGKKDKRRAYKEDIADCYRRMDELEEKVSKRDKVIEDQAQIIRELRDELSDKDRIIADQNTQIASLKGRVTKLERKNAA